MSLHTHSSSLYSPSIYNCDQRNEYEDKQMPYTQHKLLSPDVDTSIDTLTDESTIKKMDRWLADATGISFCICIRNPEGEHFLYKRRNQPCWGELRTHYKDIEKPSDLHYPFPPGTPVGIGINRYDSSPSFLKWATSSDSPWTNGFKGIKWTKDSNFIICNTHIDPTVTANLLLQLSHHASVIYLWNDYVNAGLDPKDAWLYAYAGNKHPYSMNDYAFSPYLSLEKWYFKQPENITLDAPTLYLRGAYNRVSNTRIWNGKYNLAKEFKCLNGHGIENVKEFFSKLHEQIGYK